MSACWRPTCNSQVAGLSPASAPLRSGLGQATYTCVPLSPSEIIWYRKKLESKPPLKVRHYGGIKMYVCMHVCMYVCINIITTYSIFPSFLEVSRKSFSTVSDLTTSCSTFPFHQPLADDGIDTRFLHAPSFPVSCQVSCCPHVPAVCFNVLWDVVTPFLLLSFISSAFHSYNVPNSILVRNTAQHSVFRGNLESVPSN